MKAYVEEGVKEDSGGGYEFDESEPLVFAASDAAALVQAYFRESLRLKPHTHRQ